MNLCVSATNAVHKYGQQQCLLHRFTFFSFFLHSAATLLCNPRHSDTPDPLLNPSSAPKAKQFAFLSTFPNFFLLIFFSSVPSSRYFLHVPCPKAHLYSTWGAEVVAIVTIFYQTCNTQQYVTLANYFIFVWIYNFLRYFRSQNYRSMDMCNIKACLWRLTVSWPIKNFHAT